MKKINLTFIAIMLASLIYAQNDYYMSRGKKHYLNKQPNAFIVKLEKGLNFENTAKFFERDTNIIKLARIKGDIGIVVGGTLINTKNLKKYKEFSNVMPVYQFGKLPFILTGEILMQTKNNTSVEEILKLVNNNVFVKKKAKYNTYILQTEYWDKLLEYSNLIYESGMVEYCHPNFIAPMEKYQINDPLYSEQYYLNNTGQFGGTIGIDINAPEAWSITTGSCPVRVAVIDDGVEDHEDMDGRVLQGFTPQFSDQNPDTQGAPNTNSPPETSYPNDPDDPFGHGQCCAGIIAASHNSLGIRGVSPTVDIVPINIFNDWFVIPTYYNGNWVDVVHFAEDAQDVADAIDFAWDDAEADILSNSWGYMTNDSANIPDSDAIIAAIARARSQGRNGLGSIVVFASGNSNSLFSGVTFPANVDGVITVGAIDNNGDIWNYSSRGSEMDLVAPSGGDSGDVRTIDREGINGFSSGDYYENFNGTSAACPQVSGVAALMLSVRSDMSESQVIEILQQTATDMGPSGFDNTYGFGRVNAFAAVNAIYPFITGFSPVCVSGSTFIIHNLPSNATINWTHSNFLTYISGQGTVNYTVKASRFTTSSEGWVEAEISIGDCDPIVIHKDIWVGKAGQPTTLPSGYPTIDVPLEAYLYIALTSTPGASASMPTTWWSTGSLEVENPTPSGCTFHAYETGTGNFYVTTQNACGTSVTAGGTVDVYSGGGGDDPPIPLALSIQPNPANDYIDAEIIDTDSETANSELQIILFNNRSTPVYTGNAHQKTFRINTSHLPHGLYILQVIYNGKKYSKQVLVEH